MPKRLSFSKFFLALLISLTTLLIISPSSTHAFRDEDITEFCDARSGDVINLETWYSGKCLDQSALELALGAGGEKLFDLMELISLGTIEIPNKIPSQYSGQFRGFSDIVFLDLYTRLTGDSPELANFIGYVSPDSALGGIAFLTTKTIHTPPASSIDYLAYISNNLNKNKIVKDAYAQEGFGFTALGPVLEMWKGLRNIAYSLFVLVFILYGFLIMFRVKIDPRVTTSFQLAIPKIIITLLLITFSYAIAGLLIDLSYLISLVIGNALETAGLINTESFLGTKINTAKQLTGQGLGFGWIGLQTILKVALTDSIAEIESLIFGIPTAVIGIVSFFGGISLIIKLVIIIALAYTMLKILFMFIMAYAKIILSIIFSPIILMGNVLPGSKAFGNWIRSLFAELSIFPSVIIMWLIGGTLLRTGFGGITPGVDTIPGNIWVPPAFGGALISNSGAGAGALLGYGMILLSPKIAEMIREKLNVPAFKYGSAIGESLMFGFDSTPQDLSRVTQRIGKPGGRINKMAGMYNKAYSTSRVGMQKLSNMKPSKSDQGNTPPSVGRKS